MQKDLVSNIIRTILALLGIWTANKISQGVTALGNLDQTISAGFGVNTRSTHAPRSQNP